jgi:hypothetical protein
MVRDDVKTTLELYKPQVENFGKDLGAELQKINTLMQTQQIKPGDPRLDGTMQLMGMLRACMIAVQTLQGDMDLVGEHIDGIETL